MSPGAVKPDGPPARSRSAAPRRAGAGFLGAGLLTAALLAAAFVGRSVVSSDAAEAISDTFGLFVTGDLGAATPPPTTIGYRSTYPFKSHYGVFPSLLLVPFTALPWVFRGSLGGTGLDAGIAVTWTVGALLAALGCLRLMRVLRPGASAYWAPAFLASTFAWPYAADSFFETFAAAGLAFAAAEVLDDRREGLARAPAVAATLFVGAALLKPVLWVTAPALALGAALAWRDRADASRRAAVLVGLLALGLAVAWGASALRFGGGANFGYGAEALRFTNPLLSGAFGLLLSPNRGLLPYAPLAVVGLFRLFRRQAPAPVRLLCGGVPLVLILTVARFEGWHGGSAWGPRHLLPVLPLLAAPAVLASRKVSAAAATVGVAVNALGVLVAPGAWISWVELLKPPAGAGWGKAGADFVSEVPALSPIRGHAFFLARSLGMRVASPAGSIDATGTRGPFPAAQYLSPRLLRAALGLPAVTPMSPAILHRIGIAYVLRGRPAAAVPFLREAEALDPGRAGLRELLRQLEAAAPPRAASPAGRS